jgi:hypothetical protein
MKVWTTLNSLRIGSNSGFCEHGNEPLGSIKGGEFLDQVSNCKVSRKTFYDLVSHEVIL